MHNKPHESNCHLQFPTISCLQIGGRGVSEADMADPSRAAQICFGGSLGCCLHLTSLELRFPTFHETVLLSCIAGPSAEMWLSISHRFSYGLRFRPAAEEHAHLPEALHQRSDMRSGGAFPSCQTYVCQQVKRGLRSLLYPNLTPPWDLFCGLAGSPGSSMPSVCFDCRCLSDQPLVASSMFADTMVPYGAAISVEKQRSRGLPHLGSSHLCLGFGASCVTEWRRKRLSEFESSFGVGPAFPKPQASSCRCPELHMYLVKRKPCMSQEHSQACQACAAVAA